MTLLTHHCSKVSLLICFFLVSIPSITSSNENISFTPNLIVDLKKKIPLKEVNRSLKNRTKMDKSRKNSPLIKVKDAILIRTDKLSKNKVLSLMSKHIESLN